MKMIATLTFALLLLSTTCLRAQTITLDADSVEPKSLVLKIQDQSGLRVIVMAGALNGAGKVSIHVKNKNLTQFLLEDFCKNKPFMSRIEVPYLYFLKKISSDTLTASNKPTFYWGRFLNKFGEGVDNVSVYNSKNKYITSSDSHGKFHLINVQPGDIFLFGSPEIDSGSFTIGNKQDFFIGVKYRSTFTYLPTINVIHLGIQQVASKRSVGSSSTLTGSLLQQRTSPNIYERVEGFTPGLLLTVNKFPNTYQAKYMSIGGRSTILSGPDPLVVVNGFPYAGRLEDLNPDDMESVTILRDASMISLWGALAANGVLVVTLKTGKFKHPTRVSFNTSVSVGSANNAFAKDMLAPSDRFFLDSSLTRMGYYNPLIGLPGHPYVPELALRLIKHTITDAEMMDLKRLDIRHDLNKYFYRPTLQNHFSFQLTGSKKENAYLFSLGLDQSFPELQLSKTQRLNLSFNYNIRPVEGLELSTTLATTYYKEHNLAGEPEISVTYANLTDTSGAPAVQGYKYNQFFIDTAGRNGNGGSKLRDWRYRPLQEFRLRNDDHIYMDHRIQLGLKYNNFHFLKNLEAALYAQYEITSSKENNLKDKNVFFANDLVNSFTQVYGSTVERPIPVGNILDYSLMKLNTLNLRAQLSYVHSFERATSISVLLGSDLIDTKGQYNVRRIYDYSPDRTEGGNDLNYKKPYQQYYSAASSVFIPYKNEGKRTQSNYFSYYANVNYQLKEKYHGSLSLRTDHSNIYGSSTNSRFKPLYSIGTAWDISAEDFYHPRIFELLKLRSSFGLSGNPPLGVSAVQTISMAGKNENGDIFADINNPSLPSLRWETVKIYNFGVTFRSINQIVEGTLDYYYKKGTDLVGHKSMDPTTGVASILGNVASTASHNVDLMVTTRNINRMLRWRTTFIFSYIKDYVTKTDTSKQEAWVYCDLTRFSVVRNRPLYGIYSFRSPGLDADGDPVTPDNGKDYQSITLNPGSDSLHYWGRSTPLIFGSITNELSYKRFSLSFTFNFKLGYYYREPSVNYSNIFNGSDPGSKDFAKRWQKAGDEARTHVPAMQFPANSFRDYFYIFSDPLVKRADFIRLHNIHLSYDLERTALRKLHMRLANLYLNCNNAGIVWRANKSKYDPDRLQGFPEPTIITFGFRGTFK
jgi:TonB-linked SusC/RagA family outer membrane protein